MSTRRMTVGQALIEFLAHQWTVDEVVHADGTVSAVRERTVPATFGIFGHGNVAGVGQALLQDEVDAQAAHQSRHEVVDQRQQRAQQRRLAHRPGQQYRQPTNDGHRCRDPPP